MLFSLASFSANATIRAVGGEDGAAGAPAGARLAGAFALRVRRDFAFGRVEPEASVAALPALRLVLALPRPRLAAMGAGWLRSTKVPVCWRKTAISLPASAAISSITPLKCTRPVTTQHAVGRALALGTAWIFHCGLPPGWRRTPP